MEEVFNSSLGIYRAAYVLVAKGGESQELLIMSLFCLVIGWLTYAPRNGGEFGGRLLWYLFAGCYAVFGIFGGGGVFYNVLAWYFLMGVMLKFSFEILYNNATP